MIAPLWRALTRGRRGPVEDVCLVVMGLGNPGAEYAETRHNAGWWCLDLLAQRYGIALRRRRPQAVMGEGTVEGRRVALAKPRTYVNASGKAARYLLDRYRLDPTGLLVVCDDMALPPGAMRLRPRGSSGGHRGLQSIIETLGTQEFPRLRIGIGRPPPGGDVVEFVLGRPSDQERQAIQKALERAVEAIATVVVDGIQAAMNRFN